MTTQPNGICNLEYAVETYCIRCYIRWSKSSRIPLSRHYAYIKVRGNAYDHESTLNSYVVKINFPQSELELSLNVIDTPTTEGRAS